MGRLDLLPSSSSPRRAKAAASSGRGKQVSVGGGFPARLAHGGLAQRVAHSPEQLLSWGMARTVHSRSRGRAARRLPALGSRRHAGPYQKIEGAWRSRTLAARRSPHRLPERDGDDVSALTLHNTVAYYIALIYMTSYMSAVAKIPQVTAVWIGNDVVSRSSCFLIPFMGALSDRIGRKPLLMASCIGYAILAYPLFVMASSGDVTKAFPWRSSAWW